MIWSNGCTLISTRVAVQLNWPDITINIFLLGSIRTGAFTPELRLRRQLAASNALDVINLDRYQDTNSLNSLQVSLKTWKEPPYLERIIYGSIVLRSSLYYLI